MSEYMRKQFFYKAYMGFTDAINADPALIKKEIEKKMDFFDEMYGKEENGPHDRFIFTTGDYRRFCAIYWIQTRLLIKDAWYLM